MTEPNEMFTPQNRSRVAVMGTLAELHNEPIAYDLCTLTRLVKELQPDLLCAEIHPDVWWTGDLNCLPPVYREALLPLARRSDIIIVPVSSTREADLLRPHDGPFLGLRRAIVAVLNGQLRLMQRLASGPRAINSGPFALLCAGMCRLTALVCGEQTQRLWEESNLALLKNVAEALHRDPGRRVLITVDCRRSRRLQQALRRLPEVDLVDFTRL